MKVANKLIRNISEEAMRVIEARAASGGESAESWIRGLLEEMTKVSADEHAYEMIDLYIHRIDDMLGVLKGQLQAWMRMDSERIHAEIEHPVQCLMSLLYLQSDLMHAMKCMNRMTDTLKEERELKEEIYRDL